MLDSEQANPHPTLVSWEDPLARIRPATLDALHGTFSAATMEWTPTSTTSSLTDYTVKNGVFHLLEQGRKDDAEARMLNLHFMAEFADAWPTVVEPLGAWRSVGLERARAGFVNVVNRLRSHQDAESMLVAVGSVGRFLESAGLPQTAIPLTRWLLKVHEIILGIEDPQTLSTINNLAQLLRATAEYAESEALYLRDLEMSERTLGSEHRHTVTCFINLGS
ncbi:MAG: tetratricopeptide repeat protein, partial [Myxococcota bacterium]|nr:tetratricopeptide repeat protein [Myxococcota bacterium]